VFVHTQWHVHPSPHRHTNPSSSLPVLPSFLLLRTRSDVAAYFEIKVPRAGPSNWKQYTRRSVNIYLFIFTEDKIVQFMYQVQCALCFIMQLVQGHVCVLSFFSKKKKKVGLREIIALSLSVCVCPCFKLFYLEMQTVCPTETSVKAYCPGDHNHRLHRHDLGSLECVVLLL
jgi:hypothetical protein